MQAFVLEHAAVIRLGFFLGVLLLMALWETLGPRRPLTQSRARRWLNNLALAALNTLLLRLLLPVATLAAAAFARQHGWGLGNHYAFPFWLSLPLSLLLLDLGIYLQHVLFHALPWLWRLHRVHHADLDVDVTTGVRFHPGEIVLSMLLKCVLVLLLGPPLLAVLAFEILLNASAMFSHGNVRLPAVADRWLRRLIVTPDMHRVHHSVLAPETNSNFGFNLALWDRLCGTYRAQPAAGHQGMIIGLDRIREPALCLWLSGLLRLPFVGRVRAYPIAHRWRKAG